MPQVKSNVEYKTFIKGLITEATPLTFPENASLDENNFVLRRDGGRQRRLGIDYEQNHVLTNTTLSASTISTWAISTATWENANREGLSDIAVVQIGTNLFFFDANQDSISGSPLNGGSPISISGDPTIVIDTSSVFGKLIISNGQKGILVLTYDEDTDTVILDARLILVRDIWGVDDGLVVNKQTTSLSEKHEYNLVNQGWGTNDTDKSPFRVHYKVFRDSGFTSSYPSNAQVVSAGKDPTDGGKFSVNLVIRQFFGTTPAPKGFCILDTFKRGASRKVIMDGSSLVPKINSPVGDPFSLALFSTAAAIWPSSQSVNTNITLPQDESKGGIRTSAAFAGRAWYAGASSDTIGEDDESPNLGSYIFFSQVIDNDIKIGKCYQEGDPTSEDGFDPVDSDGGAVRIPDASNIRKLIAVGRSLVVFAENGVWEISGGESNFSATNIEISKITTVGPISPESIINVEGNIFYWAEAGIYALTIDQVSAKLQAQNITENAIQTFYNDIPSVNKSLSTATFDPSVRRIRWLYSDDDTITGEDFNNKYNKELIFDIVLKAFYTSTIGELAVDSPHVSGYFLSPVFNDLSLEQDIITGIEQVQVGGVDVVVTSTIRTTGKSRVKYLTIKPGTTYGFTYSLFRNEEFLDWFTDDSTGLDAPAFLLTGYETLDDTQRRKQAPYITCSFRRTEDGFEDGPDNGLILTSPSSCLLQSQWDYADSAASGKFGPEQQVYRLGRFFVPTVPTNTFDYGQSVVVTKSKLRGRGKSLSLLFKTEPGKDLHIHGWGIQYTGNANV